MHRVDTNAWIEVGGVKRYGRIRDRWLKDMEKDELQDWILRLARELEAEKAAHEETHQLASARGCAG